MNYYDPSIVDLLRKAKEAQRKRIFISFVYDDDSDYFNLLEAWSKNEKIDLEFYNESVTEAFDSENSDYIKRKIKEKIQRASITLCLVSENTHNSKWVNWEIQESIDHENNLIAVKTQGDVKYVPRAFKDQEYIWVNEFKLDKIKSAIDRS